MLQKKFALITAVLLIASLGSVLGAASFFATQSSRPNEPHTPGLRPSQPSARLQQQTLSLNWAGYATSEPVNAVTDAKGSWTVPSLICSGKTAYAAFWVGIDGFNSSTVEQTGVLAECYQGAAYYYTWYEFYPSAPVYVTSRVPVNPGDNVFGEVSYASGLFTATITDTSTGASFTTSNSVNGAQRSSAEWITEAPSSGGQILPLADFGTAYYGLDYTTVASTNYATANGATGAIGSFGSAVSSMTMVTRSLTVKAQPSALTSDGTSFSVTYGPASTTSTSTTSTSTSTSASTSSTLTSTSTSTSTSTTTAPTASTTSTTSTASTTASTTATTTVCHRTNPNGKCVGGPNL